MSKATEDELAALHGVVAQGLKNRLMAPLIKDGEPVPGTEGLGASPSDYAAAISFLKNNSITADPKRDDRLKDLEETLTRRRREAKNSMSTLDRALEDAAKEFEHSVGFGRIQ